MPIDPLRAVYAPMLPYEFRRLLVEVGAQPSDLIDAKTGKVWDTNADIVKAAVAAPERPDTIFDVLRMVRVCCTQGVRGGVWVLWLRLLITGAFNLRDWMFTVLRIPKRTLTKEQLGVLDHDIERVRIEMESAVHESQAAFQKNVPNSKTSPSPVHSNKALALGNFVHALSSVATNVGRGIIQSDKAATLRTRLHTMTETKKRGYVAYNTGVLSLLTSAFLIHSIGNFYDHTFLSPAARAYQRPGLLSMQLPTLNTYANRQKATPVDPVSVALAALPGTVRTYAATEQCLGPLYDRRFHRLFREHASVPKWSGYTGVAPAKPKAATTYNTAAMCALRLQLLALRKPAFYGGRKLLTNHLFRPDGNPRETVAELALAVAHRWEWRDLSDVVLAKAQHALGTRRRSSSAGARAKSGTRKRSAKKRAKKRTKK